MNKISLTAEKVWSSSLGIGRWDNNISPRAWTDSSPTTPKQIADLKSGLSIELHISDLLEYLKNGDYMKDRDVDLGSKLDSED